MRQSALTKMKAPGLEWLGVVPKHWEVLKLGYLTEKIGSGKTPKGGAETYACDGVLLIRSQNVYDSGLRLSEAVFIDESVDEEMSGTRVYPGDVLLNITGASLGRCAIASKDIPRANVNQHVCIVRVHPSRAVPDFVKRAVSSHPIQSQIFSFEAGSSREGLNYGQVRSLMLPLPPLGEQLAIVDFLDRKTAEIDALVAKKRSLIEKLKEKRVALISRTVTRGLPPEVAHAAGFEPNPKMKLASIEWIDRVPAHWSVVQLKRALANSEYGISDSLSSTGSVRVLTMGNIENGRVVIPEDAFVDEVIPALLLQNDDLLFNRTNSLAHVGKVGLCNQLPDEPLTFASYLVRLRANRQAMPAFLNYLLNTQDLLGFVRSLALPSINQANLNPTRYSQIHVPLPPLAEQRAIANFLDQETAKNDSLVAKVDQAIERLQEYRAALITAAVTGKIDVRKEQSGRTGLDGRSGQDGQKPREKAGSGPARKGVHA